MGLLQCGNLTIEGESSSAVATYLRVRELDLVFDLGRCPMHFIGTNHVFISHFHLDHYYGLPVYISQRWLAGMPPGHIYVPKAGVVELREIIERISLLDCGHVWDSRLNPVEAGDEVAFRKNLVAHVLPLEHRVPAVGYLVCEARDKLKPEFYGLPGHKLAELRREGTPVTNRVELPLVAYVGDTSRVPFDAHPLLAHCAVLICECTFLLAEHKERAAKTGHLHLDNLPAILETFKGEHLILTHFSRRYTAQVIEEEIKTALPPEAYERIQLFISSSAEMVEPA